MIAYRKTNGRAHDLRCVPDGYQAVDGEITLPGWELPDIETLHDPLTPEQEKAKHNSTIDAEIRRLEVTELLPRAVREAIAAGIVKDYMRAEGLDRQTATSNLLDKFHVDHNPGLAKLMAFDAQIKALRQQRLP